MDCITQADFEKRSERLKSTTHLSTMEKCDLMAQKNNLEGNLNKSNSFSVLPIEDIVNQYSSMGFIVENNDFGTFDLLKDLERARNDLFVKQNEVAQNAQAKSAEPLLIIFEKLALDGTSEESSGPEDFILVESRRREGKRKS